MTNHFVFKIPKFKVEKALQWKHKILCLPNKTENLTHLIAVYFSKVSKDYLRLPSGTPEKIYIFHEKNPNC